MSAVNELAQGVAPQNPFPRYLTRRRRQGTCPASGVGPAACRARAPGSRLKRAGGFWKRSQMGLTPNTAGGCTALTRQGWLYRSPRLRPVPHRPDLVREWGTPIQIAGPRASPGGLGTQKSGSRRGQATRGLEYYARPRVCPDRPTGSPGWFKEGSPGPGSPNEPRTQFGRDALQSVGWPRSAHW